MTRLTSIQNKELESIIAELPIEKVQEVINFANQLRQQDSVQPRRGSAEAILTGLDEVGPLQFEEGELDKILNDLDMMKMSRIG
jgi:hypothetical protein